MNTNKQGRAPLYSESLKIAVSREYLTGNLGYGALAVKHDLPGADTVRHFVKWYKRQYPDHGLPVALVTVIEPVKTDNDRQLEKQLKEAHLKIAGLEMLIATAQKELGIDIIKKPGTKQSHK
jgi:hypothetical protein